jgi:hypothetical protein
MLTKTTLVEEDENLYRNLETLFINNDQLQELQAYLNRFNPIKVMGMESMEIRHSSILAWLLNPLETHGLGDYFLKSFLSEALSGSEKMTEISSLLISAADLSDIDVRREWRHIDIFLESESNKWAFIIENKFHSKQGKNQLEGYRNDIKKYYGNNKEKDKYQIVGIYLTLRDEEANDKEYLPIHYSHISNLLDRALKYRGNFITDEVRVFLNHYLEIITEATDMNNKKSDMQQLAKRLYQENRSAIEFIMEYGAGSEFALAIDNLIGSNTTENQVVVVQGINLVYHKSNNRQFAFLPKEWFDKLSQEGINQWSMTDNWWMNLPLIAWIQLIEDSGSNKGKIWLHAELGPFKGRKNFISTIENEKKENTKLKINFGSRAKKETTKYSKFFKQNAIDIIDVTDVDEIKDKVQKLICKFLEEFTAVAKALDKIIAEVKNEYPR